MLFPLIVGIIAIVDMEKTGNIHSWITKKDLSSCLDLGRDDIFQAHSRLECGAARCVGVEHDLVDLLHLARIWNLVQEHVVCV